MNRRNRLRKTHDRQLRDLEDHLYFLQETATRLSNGDDAYLKPLAAELRVLVCKSSMTEGLLWRIIDGLNERELEAVDVHLAGDLNREDPLGKRAHFIFAPIYRAGQGDPRLPSNIYSLKGIIKECEALVISGVGYTHEKLIRSVAEQMGSAHEDDGAEPYLVELDGTTISNNSILTILLLNDAGLVAEVGERVLDTAAKKSGFVRNIRPALVITPNDVGRKSNINKTNFECLPTPPPKEGTLVFTLRISQSDWNTNGYHCPLISQGTMSVNATIHPDASIHLQVLGLSNSAIETRQMIPATDGSQQSMFIAVTWDKNEIKFYVQGICIDTMPYRPANP